MGSLDDLARRFALREDQRWALDRYIGLLAGWRRANLSGLKSRDDLIDILLGDSLALLDVPALAQAGRRWLDLGAGAGIPGIPLAIASSPRPRLTLLEATGKKCDFLGEAVVAAGLAADAQVTCARSEQYGAATPVNGGRESHDVVLARAVAPLATLVELAAPLLAAGGVLLASKTRGAARAESAAGDEAAQACGLSAREVVPLPRSPLREAVCVVYEKTSDTPGWLPRRPGLAAKRPLAG